MYVLVDHRVNQPQRLWFVLKMSSVAFSQTHFRLDFCSLEQTIFEGGEGWGEWMWSFVMMGVFGYDSTFLSCTLLKDTKHGNS